MALPWIIGAGVIAGGLAIKKLLSDNETHTNEDRLIRKAERKRRIKAQQLALQHLGEEFQLEGEKYQTDLEQTLSHYFDVKWQEPAFKLQLTDSKIQLTNINNVFDRINGLSELERKLREFQSCYNVELAPNANLRQQLEELSQLKTMQVELQEKSNLLKQLSKQQ